MWLSTAAGVALLGLLPSAVSSMAVVVRASDDPCAELAGSRSSEATGLDAKLFLRCIKNVPFNQDKAAEAVRNLKMFLGLSTTAQYHIDPPTSELELQPFNLNKTLSKIEFNIQNNAYDSNWAFDYDVVKMFQMFRDGHTDYEPVCTHGFIYVHDYPIVSIAPEDGGLPEIYHVEKDFSATPWQRPKLGQRIKKINGKAPHDYMADFIKNSPEALNYVDPDARYNDMLYGYPEGKSRGRFARRSMWNGEDIRITWDNGTDTLVEFTAQLAAGMDMYKNGKMQFEDTKTLTELCFLSDEELTNGGAVKREAKVQKRNLIDGVLMSRQTGDDQYAPDGYPAPLAYSKEYAMATYAVPDDKETVALNIRTLDEISMESTEFVQAMTAFLKEQIKSWKTVGFKRLIIDVSGNGGGKAILPFDILKQLFPKDANFLSINMHWSPVTWAYMCSKNEHELYRDVNMKDFKDMKDMLGPVQKDGGWFSKMWKQDYVQLGQDTYDITVTPGDSQPFKPQDIAVISDSRCASACHSLVESLRAVGVRAFAYGGRAIKSSPMQPVGGTKGGKVLYYDTVRTNLEKAVNNNAVIEAAGEPDMWLLKPLPVRTGNVMVNSENKFRDGNKLPLQFVYTPACNRFFMEAKMLTDIAEVWKKTRAIAWEKDGKPTKCIDYKPIDNQDEFLGPVSGAGGAGNEKNIGRIIWEHMRKGD